MSRHDPRDLEWERRYQEKDTPWDKGTVAPPLVNFLRRGLVSGRVLVPGCGRGHDVRALARQPGCTAVGLDLAPMAVTEAIRLAAEAGSTAEFIAGDYLALPAAMTGSFDWIVEHTCFCAIDPSTRHDYAGATAKALRTGGHFFGIFYLTPDVETGPPFKVSREELTALFQPHFDLVEEWIPQETFPGREGRELVRLMRKR